MELSIANNDPTKTCCGQAADVRVQHLSEKGDVKMIYRIWHGWTTIENADIYEHLLKTEIFPTIASKNILGYRGIQLLRRQLKSDEWSRPCIGKAETAELPCQGPSIMLSDYLCRDSNTLELQMKIG